MCGPEEMWPAVRREDCIWCSVAAPGTKLQDWCVGTEGETTSADILLVLVYQGVSARVRNCDSAKSGPRKIRRGWPVVSIEIRAGRLKDLPSVPVQRYLGHSEIG